MVQGTGHGQRQKPMASSAFAPIRRYVRLLELYDFFVTASLRSHLRRDRDRTMDPESPMTTLGLLWGEPAQAGPDNPSQSPERAIHYYVISELGLHTRRNGQPIAASRVSENI